MKLLLLTLFAFAPPSATADSLSALDLPWDEYVRAVMPAAPQVKLLSTVKVGRTVTTARAPIANCGSDLKAVNLRVVDAAVTVKKFGVKFTDGVQRDYNVNKTYPAGTDSGWIDLGLFRAMDPRCPKEIFAEGSAEGTATILIWGQLK